MHALHKILVYLPDCFGNVPSDEMTDKDRIRRYAEDITECYLDHIFDWRETDTAGRWSDVYPDNILICSKNRDTFTRLLNRVMEDQQKVIEDGFLFLCKDIPDADKISLKELVDKLQDNTSLVGYPAHYLEEIASVLSGRYTFDSMFFNTHNYSSRLTPELKYAILDNPDKWALVLMDYHG